MTISNKQDIYKLPHELPNNLRLRILGNYKISGKSQNFIEWKPGAQSCPKVKLLSALAKTEIKLLP